MKKVFIPITIFVLLFFVFPNAYGQAIGTGGLYGVALTVPASFDADSNAVGTGLDLNIGVMFLNGGLSFRHWSKDITDWDKDRIRNEFAGHLGIGAFNVLQLQAGVSNAGTSLRLRSDLVFGKYNKAPIGYDRDALVITPFIEASPWAKNKRAVFGVGAGISF